MLRDRNLSLQATVEEVAAEGLLILFSATSLLCYLSFLPTGDNLMWLNCTLCCFNVFWKLEHGGTGLLYEVAETWTFTKLFPKDEDKLSCKTPRGYTFRASDNDTISISSHLHLYSGLNINSRYKLCRLPIIHSSHIQMCNMPLLPVRFYGSISCSTLYIMGFIASVVNLQLVLRPVQWYEFQCRHCSSYIRVAS